MFEFKVLAKQKLARVGKFKTPHGDLLTPQLAFVATEGEIKSIPKEILSALPVNLIIVNTFHLWVKEIIENGRWKRGLEAGNQSSNRQLLNSHPSPTSNFRIHNYANFPRPIMSDSGGFQVFSMGFGKAHGVGKIASIFPGSNNLRAAASKLSLDKNNPLVINEEGVIFTFNNEPLNLTPELSIQLQQQIGADIIFAFDECTSPLNSYQYTKEAMERTHGWLIRCLKENQKSKTKDQKYKSKFKNKEPEDTYFEHLKSPMSLEGKFFNAKNTVSRVLKLPQALFAIVQGGYFENLRKKSAKFVSKFDVPGFGIGGSLGRTKEDVWKVLEWTIPHLPQEKPRHLLGIGQVADIFESVERGVDLFDCVIPTRQARHQVIYTKKGGINVRKYKTVQEIADKNCRCQMCQEKITLYKLYELYKLDKPKAFFYATVHNIQFYADLMKEIREAIEGNKFFQLKEKFLK